MTQPVLEILDAGPQLTVQDAGRSRWMRFGVTEGGAMGMLAIEEARVLLDTEPGVAALEMIARGGKFCVRHKPVMIALTGARFDAKLNGHAIKWRTSFQIKPGEILEVGRVRDGNYGYLSVGGGIATQPVLGSRSTHLRASFGGHQGCRLMTGDILPIKPSPNGASELVLQSDSPQRRTKFSVLWGAQAHLFSQKERQRFVDTDFKISHEQDRMGAKLITDAAPIQIENGLEAISDAVALGDIQIPGDGRPIVLLRDRQPTGGYPRIATVITADICDFIQLPPGSPINFCAVTEDEAVDALRNYRANVAALKGSLAPTVRDVNDLQNLLSLNLISGVVKDGDDLPWETNQ